MPFEARQRQQRVFLGESSAEHSLTLPYSNTAAPHASTPLMPWTSRVSFSLPGGPTRQCRIPSLRYIDQVVRRTARRRRGSIICLFIFAVGITCLLTGKAFRRRDKHTLVFGRENLQQIWRWEVVSGHHPSEVQVPKAIGLNSNILNPALSPKPPHPLRPHPIVSPGDVLTLGVGPKRLYLDIPQPATHLAYPPRPLPGSIADLDIIKYYCDYDRRRYVRDCLEVLRVAGGLDNGHRLRRGDLDMWKYLYLEDDWTPNFVTSDSLHMSGTGMEVVPDGRGLRKKRGAAWEPPLSLPATSIPKPFAALPSPCDDDYPRIFHMFWTGPFTDKPYTALLSFLYTQNTGIHLPRHHETNVCRPKFWFWVNPGPAASVVNPSALRDMYEELKNNPWSAPFLHPRFQDTIFFKLWNTTEQLDNIPELKDEWRSSKVLFNSGGHKFDVPKSKRPAAGNMPGNDSAHFAETVSDKGDIYNRVGSQSADTVDKLSTVMSDMARFILCHRYGGVYLDADNLFLRDWEELWGWKGAFAYRWSRLPDYNTAILRLHKNSALGTFLFRTALKNDLDFHPMTITKYLNDAHLQDLLFRVPDALFDPAWLSIEIAYQRERPPQPVFDKFEDFFETPVQNSAAPSVMGFDGFFKGAYCYHWHNSYWRPFDRARNWPDLGPRFIASEQAGRAAAKASISKGTSSATRWEETPYEDQQDLDWATVMKRTFEAYIRGERPNMYGEWIHW